MISRNSAFCPEPEPLCNVAVLFELVEEVYIVDGKRGFGNFKIQVLGKPDVYVLGRIRCITEAAAYEVVCRDPNPGIRKLDFA